MVNTNPGTVQLALGQPPGQHQLNGERRRHFQQLDQVHSLWENEKQYVHYTD